jgi:hypothetical protein
MEKVKAIVIPKLELALKHSTFSKKVEMFEKIMQEL